jgi:hypothetical protein
MDENAKVVDGFRFAPPSLRAWLSKEIPEHDFQGQIPWTPLNKPLRDTRFSLVTSAGVNMKSDPPFDVEREKREPAWGDPSFRQIPRHVGPDDYDVNHLHINTDFVKADLNVVLPTEHFLEFEREGSIGALAPTSYSYYGYQPDPHRLLAESMPRMAEAMQRERVDAVLLTPA